MVLNVKLMSDDGALHLCKAYSCPATHKGIKRNPYERGGKGGTEKSRNGEVQREKSKKKN